MFPHTYLEHGLSILHARLQQPALSHLSGPRADIQPFITLSSETGAGATTIGQLLVGLLDAEFGSPGHGWVFLDKNLLTHALTHHHLPEQLARFLPEDSISETKAAIGELVGLHPSLWQLEQKISEAILQLAHVGRVIFVGRAAHLITRSVPGGLHVRLIAPESERVQRVAASLGLSPAAAAAHLDKNDLARRRYVRTNFGEDLEDPHLYDLVLNTGGFAPTTAARLIVDALRDRLRDMHAIREFEGEPA